ncbi:cell cycle control protein 50A-like isoform X2 [Apostichopus japonicus]|uniref:cell cycle control protein 50A-like isoform X2 n=1 Tax=Stichopus japonicus TaxID=307972 RepID=UPI003AB1A029
MATKGDEIDTAPPASPRPEVQNGSANRNGSIDEKKSKKPGNTAFKQQRLPAWQPILTAGTVLPMFFLVGITFIPLGVGFLVTSNKVFERIIPYTDCNSTAHNGTTCDEYLRNNTGGTCKCYVDFELTDGFVGDVYIYYRLSNYYQNHRRYVNSRDDLQLLGQNVANPSGECDPYDFYRYNDVNNKTAQKAYAPCGAIANSLFNDTFYLEYGYEDGRSKVPVELDFTGIAWSSDITAKFKNPPLEEFQDTVPPPNWQTNITKMNGTFQNESFVVWMRTAAFPTFRKLHSKVVREPDTDFDMGLRKGQYRLSVDYNYPVTNFGGTKSLVISTTSWLGGKNNFLGVAYIVTGVLCVVFGLIFLAVHIKYGSRSNGFSSTSSLVS